MSPTVGFVVLNSNAGAESSCEGTGHGHTFQLDGKALHPLVFDQHGMPQVQVADQLVFHLLGVLLYL